MSEIKYLVKGKFLESKEAMEWLKDNEGVFVECNNDQRFVYKEGYFIRYVYAKRNEGWYLLPYKYESLPRSEFEESVRSWVDEKMWCPVQ